MSYLCVIYSEITVFYFRYLVERFAFTADLKQILIRHYEIALLGIFNVACRLQLAHKNTS